MESAQFSCPLAPVFCFPSEPNIPERPEYEKNINTLSMHAGRRLSDSARDTYESLITYFLLPKHFLDKPLEKPICQNSQ